MLKKSTKLLTLMLSVLLVMSSMSVLTVSADAATSFSLDSLNQEVTSGSNTVIHTITNTGESGWYKIKVLSDDASTNEATRVVDGKSVTNYYEVTATIDNVSWTDEQVVSTGVTGVYPGSFYLEAGEEFTLTLTFNLSQGTDTKQTINQISFTKQEAMDISSTETTNIKATDYISADFRRMSGDGESTTYKPTAGTETDWVGKATYDAGDSAVYYVNVPEDTVYEVYAVTSGAKNTVGRFCLYVDDISYTQTLKGAATYISTAAQTDYFDMYKKILSNKVFITAGTHIIKVAVASGSSAGYFGGLKLIPANPKTVNSSENTEFSFYNDAILGETYFPNNETTATTSISGVTSSVGQVKTSVGTYATYAMYVENDGYYDITVTGGHRSAIADIYVDRELVDTHSLAHTDSGKTTYNTVYTSEAIKYFYLSSGYHIIKFNFNKLANGAVLMYKWNIEGTEFTPTIISSTVTTEIPGNTTYAYRTSQSDLVKKSAALSGAYAGKESYGYIITRPSNVFCFLVDSEKTQKYTLSSVVSGAATNAKITITDETGAPVYTGLAGNNVNVSANYYKTVKNELGEITLKRGVSKLKVVCSGGTVFLHGFELTPIDTDPKFTFTNGTTAVSDVVEGTMVLTVDLNGNNDKNMVVFAIYEENGDYPILKTSQNVAEFSGDTATATITGITLEDGKSYYAKAFVWDDVSYMGFVQTLGK